MIYKLFDFNNAEIPARKQYDRFPNHHETEIQYLFESCHKGTAKKIKLGNPSFKESTIHVK